MTKINLKGLYMLFSFGEKNIESSGSKFRSKQT
jgi:hypothetical protein